MADSTRDRNMALRIIYNLLEKIYAKVLFCAGVGFSEGVFPLSGNTVVTWLWKIEVAVERRGCFAVLTSAIRRLETYGSERR